MDYLAQKLSNSAEEDIKTLEKICADSMYYGSVAIRMPLNDSKAQAPLVRPEHRAFKPLNIFSFRISNNSQMQEIQEIYNHTGDGDSFESREFIKMECIRTPTDTPLTD